VNCVFALAASDSFQHRRLGVGVEPAGNDRQRGDGGQVDGVFVTAGRLCRLHRVLRGTASGRLDVRTTTTCVLS